ncbi:MAG TPA: type II toxin-antitoxin system Phd/YefM family antitoxin [Polyangia bacterium]|jgi:prevent-host-death family protein|nr:type II toxin-antitoxin system Phd/YefM family antitoxin [Polyangia bacterium]
MTRKLSVAAAKARLSEVIREVELDGGPIIIERRGQPVAVIERYSGQSSPGADWFTRLYGRLADVDDFDRIMKDVVRSRGKSRTRAVNLDENT